MYYESGTVALRANNAIRARWASGKPSDAAGYAAARGGRILSWPCEIENPTSSIDAYLLKEQSCQIFHPDPIWNHGVKPFLKSVAPITRTRATTTWVAICDQFLVQKDNTCVFLRLTVYWCAISQNCNKFEAQLCRENSASAVHFFTAQLDGHSRSFHISESLKG